MRRYDYWPLEDPGEVEPTAPAPPAPRRELSPVEQAFPAGVSPNLMKAPAKYWAEGRVGGLENRTDPWVSLAGRMFFGLEGLSLLRRKSVSKEEEAAAWVYARACPGSFDLPHAHKIVVVAWILETTWWGYWIGDLPEWVTKLLEEGEE
jgi:hypothetical protein